MASELRFYLEISPEEALRYYQGQAKVVVVTATTGQKLQFPAEHIRPYINQSGVSGFFSIQFDDDNKLIGLKRL